jgi:hypothetical protein
MKEKRIGPALLKISQCLRYEARKGGKGMHTTND